MADDDLRADLADTTDPAKGAALVGYRLPELSAVGREVGKKLQERVSVLDFGAIGDGVSRPLSSVFSSLAAAQAVYPHAEALTDELDWAATQAAINLGVDRGGLEILFPGSSSVYVFGENQVMFGSIFTGGAVNIRLRGEGGRLRFRRYGLDTNLFRAVSPNGVEIHDFTVEGGQLGLSGSIATGGQGLSFSNPKNCLAVRLRFLDTRGFNILWYGDTGHGDAPLHFNNHIVDCVSDGAGVSSSAFLMADLSNSSMVRPYAVNQTGLNSDDTIYTFNLKGNCINCQIMDFVAENCLLPAVLSDEGQSTLGSGCKNAVVTGTARNCRGVFSSNAATGTYARIAMDGCGDESINGAVSIAGFNTGCVHNIVVRNVPNGATVIYSTSAAQIFNIEYWDYSGAYLFTNNASGRYNEINVLGGPNRNGSGNPWSKINAASEEVAPRLLDMRDVSSVTWDAANSRWVSGLYALIPGQTFRTAHGLEWWSNNSLNFRVNDSTRLRYSVDDSAFGPVGSSDVDLGFPSRSFRNGYFQNLVLTPPASGVDPAGNGGLSFQLTSNTSLQVKVRGSDGIVRTGTITLS